MTKRARIFALAVTALVIATATLTPGTEGLHPAASISRLVRHFLMDAGLPYRLGPLGFEFLANIVMFVPLGVFLALLWWRRWRGLLFAIPPLASLGIETFQFLFLPHRGPQFEDIIANSLGGWLGLSLFVLAGWTSMRTKTITPTSADASAASLRAVMLPATLDTIAWGAAIGLTGLLTFNFQAARIPWRGELYLWLVVTGLQIAVGWLLEAYPAGRLRVRERTFSLIVGTLGVGTTGWILTLFWGPAYGLPRSLMVAATPLALMVTLSVRYVGETVLKPRDRLVQIEVTGHT